MARLAALGCRRDSAEDAGELSKKAEAILLELAGTGTKAGVPQILGGLAEFCLEHGHPEQAAGYVDAAFAISQGTGQPHWDAELARTRTRLRLAQQPDAVDAAEAGFREAIEIASTQQARGLELRAANSLAQLLCDLDRPGEATDLVRELHGWFSEGFDTEDWSTARALLDDLA